MKSKKVKEFEVRELTVGALLPIMDLMSSDPQKFQLELAKACIFKDGEKLGEKVLELGLGDYVSLMSVVMEVSGLAEEKKA